MKSVWAAGIRIGSPVPGPTPTSPPAAIAINPWRVWYEAPRGSAHGFNQVSTRARTTGDSRAAAAPAVTSKTPPTTRVSQRWKTRYRSTVSRIRNRLPAPRSRCTTSRATATPHNASSGIRTGVNPLRAGRSDPGINLSARYEARYTINNRRKGSEGWTYCPQHPNQSRASPPEGFVPNSSVSPSNTSPRLSQASRNLRSHELSRGNASVS